MAERWAVRAWFGAVVLSKTSLCVRNDALGSCQEVELSGIEEILEAAMTHCHLVVYCRTTADEQCLLIMELANLENSFKFSLITGEAERYHPTVSRSPSCLAIPEDSRQNTYLTATESTVFFVEGEHVYRLFSDEELLNSGKFRPESIDVPSHSRIIQVCSGLAHSVFLTEEGEVFTMGCGSKGELGLGGNVFESKELCLVEALEGIRVVKVAAGSWHTAVLTDTDDVYLWGWNLHGQAGPENVGSIHWQPHPMDLQSPCKDIAAEGNLTSLKILEGSELAWSEMGTHCVGEVVEEPRH